MTDSAVLLSCNYLQLTPQVLKDDRFRERNIHNPERAESEKTIEALLVERGQLNTEWAELHRRTIAIHAALKELLTAQLSDEMMTEMEQLNAESDRIHHRQHELLDLQAEMERQLIELMQRSRK